MIERVRFRNFKSFGEFTEVNLRPLTVLLGKNNSGKTTVMRTPAFILDALDEDAPPEPSGVERGPLPLHSRGISVGNSYRDLVHAGDIHGSFEIGLSAVSDRRYDADIEVQLVQSMRSSRAVLSQFSLSEMGTYRASQPQLENARSFLVDGRGMSTEFRGLVPDLGQRLESGTYQQIMRGIRTLAKRTALLSSTRMNPSTVYSRTLDHEHVRARGSAAPYMLYEDQALLDRVADWYQVSVTQDRLAVVAETLAFQLVFSKPNTGEYVDLARSGRGVQQVLPVITYLEAMISDVSPVDTLFIEEPELHLHPAAHGALADTVTQVATAGRQVVVETHSENFVLRIRRRVADGTLDPMDVRILWFRTDQGQSMVTEIDVDRDGSVSDWPVGVFSEDLDEVRAIASASRKRNW